MDEKAGAKEKILDVVVKLLLENKDLTKVTNRQIAALAGVNSALINYYYQSKENLIGLAAGACMADIAGALYEQTDKLSPSDRVKRMLKNFAEFCFKNVSLAETIISAEIKQGSFDTCSMLLPLLEAHYGETKNNFELKLLTFQLLLPMQMLFLNRSQYKNYMGSNLIESAVWERIIDQLVDQVFTPSKEGE